MDNHEDLVTGVLLLRAAEEFYGSLYSFHNDGKAISQKAKEELWEKTVQEITWAQMKGKTFETIDELYEIFQKVWDGLFPEGYDESADRGQSKELALLVERYQKRFGLLWWLIAANLLGLASHIVKIILESQ